MCLAIPGQVIALDPERERADISYDGLVKQASTRLAPQTAVNDQVLVHAGFIIQILSPEEGAELTELAREVGFYE